MKKHIGSILNYILFLMVGILVIPNADIPANINPNEALVAGYLSAVVMVICYQLISNMSFRIFGIKDKEVK